MRGDRLVGLLMCILLSACGSEPVDTAATESPDASAASQASAEPGVVLVKADDYSFTAPPTFPSGWVRLRFDNQGAEPHFAIIWDLPDGKTFDDYVAEVGTPFQDYYTKYRSGEWNQETFFEELIAVIPAWFYEAVPKGGPGFTAPGTTSEILVYLEPGDNYLLECYVRSMKQDDRFHGSEGMLRPLIVEGEPSGLEPPEADIEIVLSSFEIELSGDLTAGPHIVRVRVEDTPEGFIRHNVHLARLAEGQTGADLAPWLNWVDEMLPPAPAVFMGGAGQMAGGRESYLVVDLEPGRYTWISEMFGIQGMLQDFVVE